MSQRDRILATIPTIPSLPTAATEVLQRVQNPDSSMDDIMAAIRNDPGLTAEVLRLANTAYFAGPRSIATLRDAGVLLGTQRILQLVLTSAVVPIARVPLKGYDLPSGQLVQHALATAAGAEILASLTENKAPNHTFTAGLLADIGKIVLGSFLEVDAQPIVETALSKGVSFEIAEHAVLGIDHAEVGAALLDTWGLPENVIEVVRWHHAPGNVSGDPLTADLVHVAGFLSTGCGIGAGVDGLNYHLCHESMERLGATPPLLEKTTCDMLVALEGFHSQLSDSSQGDPNGL